MGLLEKFRNRNKRFSSFPYAALNDLDRKLERLCPELLCEDTYFIEAGANDGIKQSNTYFLEKKYGARGLLIEPCPNLFLDLLKNRSHRNDFACYALVPFGFENRFVEMIYADLMTVAVLPGGDLGGSHLDHAKEGRRFMDEREENFRFGAVAYPLRDILDEVGAPSEIGLLSLDVEGNELSALAGVDYSRTSFRNILLESRDVAPIRGFLGERGYILKEKLSYHDYLFSKAD